MGQDRDRDKDKLKDKEEDKEEEELTLAAESRPMVITSIVWCTCPQILVERPRMRANRVTKIEITTASSDRHCLPNVQAPEQILDGREPDWLENELDEPEGEADGPAWEVDGPESKGNGSEKLKGSESELA
ncbi:hypothetical protein FALBO_7997 [Fusarium albosuccineum]|uniref:Uncharacterized protein n=1 Tax=Fusarium albosuccineum TaxID=1237068 RepID=A0A8H4LBR6_9HYPO|nr:hypothetical protein FALBO_7997 [Fusarium albosuccineum]